MTRSDCAICAAHRGVGPLAAAPVVWEDDTVVVVHVLDREPAFLGHLVVESRRHAPYLDGLTAAEAAAVGRAVRAAAAALRAELDVEFVHSAVVTMTHEHFHQHVHVRHRGTPPDVRWHASTEWPDAPHGDADAVRALCARLRQRLNQELRPAVS